MWPLSLNESFSGSVMTKRSGGRTHQLSSRRYDLPHQPPQPPRSRGRCRQTLDHPTLTNNNSNSSDSSSSSSISVVVSPVVKRFSQDSQQLTPAEVADWQPQDRRQGSTLSSSILHLRYLGARWIDALTKVVRVRVRHALVLLLLLLLSLHAQPAMGKPRNSEHPHQITFESRFCRPVSAAHLRSRMGRHYDERKMASDVASAKRQFQDMRGYQGDDPFAGDDDDDDGGEGGVSDGLDGIDLEALRTSGEVWIREEGEVFEEEDEDDEEDEDGYDDDEEEEVQKKFEFELDVKNGNRVRGGGEEEEEEEDEEEEWEKDRQKGGEDRNERRHRLRRTWLPRRRILGSHRRDEGRFAGVSDSFRFGKDGDASTSNSDSDKQPDSFNGYMRRRRRRRRSPDLDVDPKGAVHSPRLDENSNQNPTDDDNDSNDNKNKNNDNYKDKSNAPQRGAASRSDKVSNSKTSKKSSKNHIPLLLVLGGGKKRRKSRKKLRKEFRQRARKHKRPPPWQCRFEHVTVMTKETVFPRVIRDGKCMSDKCFYRLYNCEPIKYAIKVLKRDPNHCNPLPLEGNFTTYEESWNLESRHINVGCSCSSLAESSRSKNRRTK